MIQLPKTDKEGNFYTSYSQIETWNAIKTFKGLEGRKEYIRKYFLGEKEEDDKAGFATFGKEVENYICERADADKFTSEEKKVLNEIVPLGHFQTECKIAFPGFYVLCYIDDRNADFSHLRDYKTCSEKSGIKYTLPEYEQLDIYAMAAKQITGKIPERLEVLCIERSGNGFRGGRSVLQVGNKFWNVHRSTTEERLKTIENKILTAVTEISEYYSVFKKLNII